MRLRPALRKAIEVCRPRLTTLQQHSQCPRPYCSHCCHVRRRRFFCYRETARGQGTYGCIAAVAANLLSGPQDYDLSAVFMRNWDTRDELGTDDGCEWKKDWEDVQHVCRMLDIPCEMVRSRRRHALTVSPLTVSCQCRSTYRGNIGHACLNRH